MSDQLSTSKPPCRTKQQTARRRGTSQRTIILSFALVSLAALSIFVIRSSSRPAITSVDRADPTNATLVARGEQLYATRCASCHGIDLKGQPGWPERQSNGVMPASPLDESGRAWQQTDQWLFTTIKHGGQATASPGTTSYMPPFAGGLSDGEIWAILSYIKNTWPTQIQPAPQGEGTG